jgi:putative ABC transport system permease protein
MVALVLLVLVRTDLINGWRQATPRNAPDHVIFNIQPEQAQGLRERLEGAGVTGQDFYAVSRGRLVAINGEPVTMDTKWRNDTARRMGEREWNIGYSEQQPKGSSLKSGEWTSGEPGTLSMEWGPAGSMGLKLGDRLSFDVGGQRLEGRITSLRNVDWSAMRLNFVVIVPRKPDPTMDHAYVAAYRMPAARPGFDGQLLREFPGITSVDLTTSLAQVQSVLDQVSQAVEFLFGFTLASGLVVLFAAVAATREARAREYAVMRALGASRGLLRRVQGAELIGVGALAGLLAASAGMGVGHLLARYVFHFTWQPSPQTPLAGMAAGALLALAAGWWSLRGVLRRPVVQTLRRTAQ